MQYFSKHSTATKKSTFSATQEPYRKEIILKKTRTIGTKILLKKRERIKLISRKFQLNSKIGNFFFGKETGYHENKVGTRYYGWVQNWWSYKRVDSAFPLCLVSRYWSVRNTVYYQKLILIFLFFLKKI